MIMITSIRTGKSFIALTVLWGCTVFSEGVENNRFRLAIQLCTSNEEASKAVCKKFREDFKKAISDGNSYYLGTLAKDFNNYMQAIALKVDRSVGEMKMRVMTVINRENVVIHGNGKKAELLELLLKCDQRLEWLKCFVEGADINKLVAEPKNIDTFLNSVTNAHRMMAFIADSCDECFEQLSKLESGQKGRIAGDGGSSIRNAYV